MLAALLVPSAARNGSLTVLAGTAGSSLLPPHRLLLFYVFGGPRLPLLARRSQVFGAAPAALGVKFSSASFRVRRPPSKSSSSPLSTLRALLRCALSASAPRTNLRLSRALCLLLRREADSSRRPLSPPRAQCARPDGRRSCFRSSSCVSPRVQAARLQAWLVGTHVGGSERRLWEEKEDDRGLSPLGFGLLAWCHPSFPLPGG